jgi:hypothetical protein
VDFEFYNGVVAYTKGVRIPQPEGWGAFTSAYRKRGGGFLQSPNRKVGDLSFQPTAWEDNEPSRMDQAALGRLA